MSPTQLDRDLAKILQPVVEEDALLRLAAYANTLCVGYHYFVASDQKATRSHIQLTDWNKIDQLVAEVGKSPICFYTDGARAKMFRDQPDQTGGVWDSVAVTRFSPRFAFFERTSLAESFGRNTTDQYIWSDALCAEIAGKFSAIDVVTDIKAQARKIVGAVQMVSDMQIAYPGSQWPRKVEQGGEAFKIYIYGAPFTSYLSTLTGIVRRIEIPDDKIIGLPEFETHMVWHIPASRKEPLRINAIFRKAFEDYHEQLFEAAVKGDNALFRTVTNSCNEILALRHPSFPLTTFPSAEAFRRCLSEHHHGVK